MKQKRTLESLYAVKKQEREISHYVEEEPFSGYFYPVYKDEVEEYCRVYIQPTDKTSK